MEPVKSELIVLFRPELLVLIGPEYTALDISAVTTINYIWHVITAENFIFGIAFIIMAFYRDSKNVRFSAWLICSILITRLFVIVGTTLIMTGGQINDLMIDIIAIVIYTGIILIGTRAKSDKKR